MLFVYLMLLFFSKWVVVCLNNGDVRCEMGLIMMEKDGGWVY